MVYKFLRRWKGLFVAGLVVFLLSSVVVGAEKRKEALDTISVKS